MEGRLLLQTSLGKKVERRLWTEGSEWRRRKREGENEIMGIEEREGER